MLTGNKGEWSEVYTLLKIIGDRQLYQGDGNLNRIPNAILPIIKVLRDESDGTYEYNINQNLVVINGAGNSFSVSILDFQRHASALLEKIKSSKSTFSVPEIEAFINLFNCSSLKAGSGVKSDIRVVLHDAKTGISPELGFSIKSQLGNASTLLNAGKTTNFIYKIHGVLLSKASMDEINAIDSTSKIKDRLTKITSQGRSLSFLKVENSIFSNNLTLIDSALPAILAEIVYLFYASSHTSLGALVEETSIKNPLHFDGNFNHPFYFYKIKRFLTDVALGMMPSKVWTGALEATGGYLVVKDDGEILSYHIYNRNDFEDYLLNNTKLETASSTRHEFGQIYEENGSQFLKLNLQIRFIR